MFLKKSRWQHWRDDKDRHTKVDTIHCECGHTYGLHVGLGVDHRCVVEESRGSCGCTGFRQMDWITDFCDTPEKIHVHRS